MITVVKSDKLVNGTLTPTSSYITSAEDKIVLQPRFQKETRRKNLDGWEIEVELPLKYREHIKQGYIVLAETKESGVQPFRINNMYYNKHIVSFTAYHIMFDTNRLIVEQVSIEGASLSSALQTINNSLDIKSPYTVSTTVSGEVYIDVFGAPYLQVLKDITEQTNTVVVADGWNLEVRANEGRDRGETISYSKNLANFDYRENFDSVVTKIYPFFQIDEETRITLPEIYIEGDVQYTQPFSKSVEFTPRAEVWLEGEGENEEQILNTEVLIADLRQQAENYLTVYQYPLTSLRVTSHLKTDVRIGDTVHLKHPALTQAIPVGKDIDIDDIPLSIPIEVYAYEYDMISKTLLSITYGDYETSTYKQIQDMIEEKADEVQKDSDKKYTSAIKWLELLDKMQGNIKETIEDNWDALQDQAEIIENLNKNGHAIIYEDEHLFVDRLPVSEATNVLKLGAGGILASTTGVDGPYDLAIGIDGTINASLIKFGKLDGGLIEVDSIKSDSLSLEAREFILNLTQRGGGNFVHNSVFLAGDKFWQKEGAAKIERSNSNWVMQGVSRSGITVLHGPFEDSKLRQKVVVVTGEIFTLSFRAFLSNFNIVASVKINEISESDYLGTGKTTPIKEHIVEVKGTGGSNYKYEFVPESQYLEIEIITHNRTAGENMVVELSDIMLARGFSDVWEPAPGEIYGADVQIDHEGIRVLQRSADTGQELGHTSITPHEFSGYYGGQQIFTLNRDITEVMGLKVKEKGLYVPPIKMVQNKRDGGSLDIVWTGFKEE